MKKLKVSLPKTLPADFTSTTAPETAASPSTPSAPAPSLIVPQIDKDSSLEIERFKQPVLEETPLQEKHGRVLFVLGTLFGILLLSAVAALGYFYFTLKSASPVTAPSPIAQITAAPTPTVISNADITFEVLNGSGIAGQAAKYGQQLTTLGYKVATMGNAATPSTGLTVQIAASLANQKDSLLAALQKAFPAASYSGILTDSSSLVRLTIGK